MENLCIQEKKDQDFINWCIEQSLNGEVSTIHAAQAIEALKQKRKGA